jgi:hypothetical protein
MISPHFPPDSSAGTHRVRLLAPYLEQYGWTPTVLTVDPSYYEGALDSDLEELVPSALRVERSRAISADVSRIVGVGDLGLRSFGGLYVQARRLLSSEPHDAIYITVYPTYTALLGPLLKRRFNIPFVLDYQDPWVGSWGEMVGGGEGGKVDAKSRLSRRIAMKLEPFAVRAADAITAVSIKTAQDVIARIPLDREVPLVEIPIGGDQADFDAIRSTARSNSFFDATDGLFHLCCVGTLLPLGMETLSAFLSAVVELRNSRTDLYERLRVHFIGTSNARTGNNPDRIMPRANKMGLSGVVSEHPTRVDYADAVNVQIQASALLLLGSSEHHYTASRLYPALLARRPLLGLYHRLSSVSKILAASGPGVHLVQFGDEDPAMSHVTEIGNELASLIGGARTADSERPTSMDDSFSARQLAGRLGSLLDRVAASRAS